MRSSLVPITVAALVLAAITAPFVFLPAEAAAAPDGGAESALSAAEAALVAQVTARFVAAGLELPKVAVSFHSDRSGCKGFAGLYTGSSDVRWAHRVAVCVPDLGSYASQQYRTRTLTHELAHAWAAASFDEGAHQHLNDTVGATAWGSADVEWVDRGVERVAETIVWGLFDQLRRPVLIDTHCEELFADFVELTGTQPLGPIENHCYPDSTGKK